MPSFLPLNKKEMQEKGWEQADFIFVTGDAYVDHPSFGVAIISRVLESFGYKVAILSQPDWTKDDDLMEFGAPKLAFLVTAGNIDSMVNHYTVAKKRRTTDAYTPGGEMGKRPDRPTIVYSNWIRKVYKDSPIIIGGIEASLRRLAHYDYWSNHIKRSVLLDSQADLLLYGMGEKTIVEVAEALQAGIAVTDITFIRSSVYRTKDISSLQNFIVLPSYEEIKENKENFAKSFKIQFDNTDFVKGKTLVEPYNNGNYIVQNPAMQPLNEKELDRVYSLEYMRNYHPSYEEKGGVPAITEVKFSLISNRGCFGGCNFCALTFHQGRVVQSRSHESLIEEAKQLTWEPDFKGYIHDVGGPTANFRKPSCTQQLEKGVCRDKQCLFPEPCNNLTVDHSDYLELLRKLRTIPKVKKVFIRSGIRFDYLLLDKKPDFFNELVEHHVSGQLKVAPEHVSNKVLSYMGKPPHKVYDTFVKKYVQCNEKLGLKQFLVPYLMSSHPSSDIHSAIELAEYLRDIGQIPEQVQDFYPTPGTVSTCMYFTELDPMTMQKVYVPKDPHEKAMQRALIQYRSPHNYKLVHEALVKAGRTDLIGFERKCLIKPMNGFNYPSKKVIEKDKPKKKTIRNIHKKKK